MPEAFKPDTLLMFSGGLDSTGAFWKMLQQGRKLHVHHMNLRNVERRARAEAGVIGPILKYMGSIGPFIYSESTHEYPCYNGQFVWDSDIVAFMSGNICMASPWLKEVAIGMTASDHNDALQGRIQRSTAVFKAFVGESVKKIYPVFDMTKQQIYDMLPKDLVSLTWSCRTPLYTNGKAHPCNNCQTCQEIHKLNK